MKKYQRIFLLALFFSFIGVGFSNGLLFKKNKLVEEVIEYDEVIRKVRKGKRRPASIHSAQRKKVAPSVVADTFIPDLPSVTQQDSSYDEQPIPSAPTYADDSSSSRSEQTTYLSGSSYQTGASTQTADLPSRAPSTHSSQTHTTSSQATHAASSMGSSYTFTNYSPSTPAQGTSILKVKSITFKDGAFVIKGENLNTVKRVTLKSNEFSSPLEKISSNSSEIWAMGMSALKLIAGKTYSLIIADAYGSSTYPISVELADGSVTPRKLSPLGAAEDGYILKWDASSQAWIAAPDEVGAGSDGGITSLTKGVGIVGQGSSITTTGSIAVDVGTNAGQIPQFDSNQNLVLTDQNKISFSDGSDEYTLGFFSGVFRFLKKDIAGINPDVDLFSVSGDSLLINGKGVCYSDGTNCPATAAAVESITTSAPLTMSGTANVSLGLAIDNTTITLDGSSQLTIPNAAITTNKLHPMGATTTGQVLKWNGSTWWADADNDTGITVETDPNVRAFARKDASGVAPANCNQDETWVHDIMLDTFVCRDISITTSHISDLNLHWDVVTGGINYAGGNVGIGTTNPNVTFDVRGKVQIGSTGNTSSTIWPFFISDSSNLGWKVADNAGNGKFELYAGYMGLNQMRLMNGVTLHGHLQDLTLGATNAESALTIKQTTGKIGVGTTTPEASFHISKPRWNTDTTPPQFAVSGSRAAIALYDENQTGANIFAFENGEEALNLYSTTHTANDWGYDERISRMTVLGSNGNVGIGTTTPSAKLEVAGIVKATGFEGPMTSTSVSTGTGTASAPAYSFSNSSSTGLFSSTAGTVGVSSGGTHTFNFTTGGLSSPTVGGASIGSSAGTVTTPTFSFAGDEDTGWYAPLANTLAAATGGVERMRIGANGFVGIGTSTPTASLDIVGANYKQLRLKGSSLSNQELWAGSVADTVGSYIGNNAVYNASFEFIPNYGSASGINFRQDGSTEFWNDTGLANGVSYVPTKRMVISKFGNVGIGTTNPLHKFHISVPTLSTSTIALNLETYGNVNHGRGSTIQFNAPNGTGVSKLSAQIHGGNDVNSYNQVLDFKIHDGTNFNSALTLEADRDALFKGNVGIGTSAPFGSLHINNDGGADSKDDIWLTTFSDTTSPAMFFTKARGSQAAPTSTLTTDKILNITASGHNGTSFVNAGSLRVIASENFSTSAKADMAFFTNSGASDVTEKMRITDSGVVGIGTSTPNAGLEVAKTPVVWTAQGWRKHLKLSNGGVGGNTSVEFDNGASSKFGIGATSSGGNTFFLWHTTASDNSQPANYILAAKDNGNIGIGTSLPTTKLEVNGIVKATGFQGPMTSTSVSSGTGSSAAPSYSFSNSASTGLFSSSAGVVGVSSGGTHTFNFTSGGLNSATAGGAKIASSTGTSATPTFSFSGDEDTGWFSPLADNLAASTAGVERIRINSAGNVGIGTNNPTRKLIVRDDNGGTVGEFVGNPVGENKAVLFKVLNENITAPADSILDLTMITSQHRYSTLAEGGPSLVALGENYTGSYGLAKESVFDASQHSSGMYLNNRSVGDLRIGSNTIEHMRILRADGRVGIGTANPLTKLHVESTADASISSRSTSASSYGGFNVYDANGVNAASFQYGNTSSPSFTNEFVIASRQASIPLKFYQGGVTAANEKIRIDQSSNISFLNANVGIGTTTPGSILTIAGATPEATVVTPSKNGITHFGNGASYIQGRDVTNDVEYVMGTSIATEVFSGSMTAHDYSLRTGNTPKIMIKHVTGNVGIGTTSPSEKLHVSGNILATGTITPSDIRLKKNFEPVENALDKINGLSAVTYDWKDQKKFSEKRQMGVIAQEVEKAFPEAVTKTNEGFLAVSYSSLISPLIAAVKELYSMVIELFEGQKEINRAIASKADQVEIDEIKMQNEKLAEENRKIKEENQELKARLDKIEKALGL